jgi:PAS domain-containing protein
MSTGRGESWLRRRATVLGILALLALVTLDVLAGERVIPIVFVVVAPLAVALTGVARGTAVVAALAILASATIALTADTGSTSRWLLTLAGIAVGSALAVSLAELRRRADVHAERLRALSDVERQLTSALGALGEAVTVTDVHGQILYANDAAVELLRAGSEEELLRARPGEVMERFAVYDEAGRPVCLEQLPGVRLLEAGTEVEPLLVRNVVKATGEERWLFTKASLVPGSDPGGARVVNVIEDLTVLKRAELRQRLLAEATRVLGASLGYEDTLQRVAEVVVPDLADWCSVSMPGHGPKIGTVAVAHVDPEKIRAAHALDAGYPNLIDDDTDLAQVLRGEPGPRVIDVPEGAVEAYAVDDEHLRLLREVGFGAILIVPLDAGGRRLGAMILVRSDPLRRFGEADVQLAEDLAGRAATAVLNARLYTERAELAATLQRGMLPPPLPRLEGWSAAAFYHPAGEIGEVGGDFYDAFRYDDDWMVVIGDVAGHGPEAAAVTAQARYTLRTAARITGDPVAAIAHLNRSLREQSRFDLCTAVCVRLSARADGPTVSLASCGHPPPFLVRDGTPTAIGTAGPIAGAFDDCEAAWPLAVVPLRAGDALVLYTDGVVDALSHRGRRGEARMHALLAETPTTAERLITRLDAALAAEPDQRRRDDTAAVVLQLLPTPVPSGA